MRHLRILFTLSLLPCLFATALAQNLARDGSGSDARELKRSAHRLRIGVEQLKNARQALREATELAMRLDPAPAHQFASLGASWLELDRSRAAEKLESLYNDLRNAAQAAATGDDYQRCSSAVLPLLSSIGTLDPDRALQLAGDWPTQSKSQGEGPQAYRDQLLSNFFRNNLMQLSQRDPDKALALLSQRGSSNQADYWVRGQLASQLSNMGRKEDALTLIDRTISDFGQRPSTGAVHDYANFLQQIPSIDTERFMRAYTGLVQSASQLGTLENPGGPVRIGEEMVPVTQAETVILNALRGLQGRPELALKALNAVPGLKAKVDQFGGIDSFFNPNWNSTKNNLGSPATVMSSMSARRNGVIYVSNPVSPESKDSPMRLKNELRGKARTNRSTVRQRLTEAAGTPERVDALISLAQMSSYDDPELSSLALEVASSVVSQVEPLTRRVNVLQNLINTYRQVEGEVDPNLIKEGYQLADRMREDEEARNPSGNTAKKGNMLTQADHLELMLLSQYSRDNFDASIRYVRSLPDNEFKLSALVQIAQSQRNPY